MFEAAARRTLELLQERVGHPALAAAANLPGLVAAVDQHAAAVRDILSYGVEGQAPGEVLLAGYAKGLLDQAGELGWQAELPKNWSEADWLLTRLTAICTLARHPTPAPEPSG